MSRLSIRTRLVVILASVAIVSSGVASLMGYRTARRAIEHQSYEKLIAVRETKGNQVEDYIRNIVSQTLTMAESPLVIDAMRDFRVGFRAINDDVQLEPRRSGELDQALRVYYQEEFLQRLAETAGPSGTLSDHWPQSGEGRLLQQFYIADNPLATGSKHQFDAAEDGSRYSAAHLRHHPLFRNFLDRFGYYDIFLVDAESGYIVYSVFKEVDFGTSLLSGPYRDSNLAAAFRAARESGAPGFVRLVDFQPYGPSYGAHASFIATPVFSEGDMLGVLAFQMPVDRINDIMTNRAEWGRVGLGESGETYIVGEDLTLRNQSRFLIEDRESYLQAIQESGAESSQVQKIGSHGSIGLQKVETEGAMAAVGGKTGTGMFPDYRNVPVLSAYRPLDLPDLRWAILSEIDRAEALGPIRAVRNQALVLQVVLIAIIVAVAFWFSATLIRPLKQLREVARGLASGRLEKPLVVTGQDEIASLAHSFEAMRKSLSALVKQQEREIEALAVPLIPLREDVVAMPLVGEIDARRLERVRRTLVDGLHASGAKAALLDLTGVPSLDRDSAVELIRTAKAAGLLGVKVVLTGVQAEVARNLTDLDVHLDGIETARSLEAGIQAIFSKQTGVVQDAHLVEDELDGGIA